MDILLGSWHLEQPAGRGGMSEVWQATHHQFGLPAAVKILRVESELLRLAFAGEVRAMARLEHPNVVAVFGHGRVSAEAEAASRGRFAVGTPWLAMEYCSGGTLDGFIPTNWNGLRRILMDLLGALSAAHARGVLHLDLKPENVLVASPGDLRPGRKLTDFGLSFAEQSDDDASVLGTPAWMAPEQFRRQWRDYGPWTDLYALGCVGYALATGQPPFGLGRPPEVLMMAHEELPPPRLKARFGVPEGLERWLGMLLEKHPARRFQTASEALLALQSADGDPPPAGRVSRGWRGVESGDVRVATLSSFGLRKPQIQGRIQERDRLWDRLLAVERAQRGELVVLSGEPGIGKSALMEWFCERAAETGSATVLKVEATGAPGAGAVGLIAAIRQSLRCEGLLPEEMEERLSQRLPDMDPDERQMLARLLGGQESGEGERMAILCRFLGMMQSGQTGQAGQAGQTGQARGAPLLIWMEEGLHPTLMALLDRLLSPLSALPFAMLIVLTLSTRTLAAAPQETERLENFPRLTWLALRPLPDVDILALLTAGFRLGGELAAPLVDRAKGNPGFALQAIRDWVHSGLLQPGVEGLRATAAMSGSAPAMPEDEQILWSARMDRALIGAGLDVYTSRLQLDVAALCGDPFDEQDWIDAIRLLQHPEPAGLIDALLQARLLSRRTEEGRALLHFAHPLIREGLLAEAEAAGRARPGRIALARSIQKQLDRPDVPDRITDLLLALGLDQEALRILLLCARQAPDRTDSLRRLDRAAPLLRSLPPGDRRHAEADLLRARCAHADGDYEGARAAAQRAADGARSHGHADLLASALLELADCTRIRGSPSLALALFQEAQSLHQRQNDRAGLAVCLAGLGELASQMGELNQAIRLLQQAAAISQELGRTREQADALRELADAARRAGRLEAAEAWAAEALTLYQSLKTQSGVAAMTNIQAAILRQSGRLFAAEGLAFRALRQCEALESRQITFPLLNLALIYLQMDRAPEARPLVERALPLLRSQGRQVHEATAHAVLLPCLVIASDLPAWDLHFNRLQQLIEQTDTIDPDIAEALTLSSRLLVTPLPGSSRGRDPRRAAQSFELARSQWLALGFQVRVAETNAALMRLGD